MVLSSVLTTMVMKSEQTVESRCRVVMGMIELECERGQSRSVPRTSKAREQNQTEDLGESTTCYGSRKRDW